MSFSESEPTHPSFPRSIFRSELPLPDRIAPTVGWRLWSLSGPDLYSITNSGRHELWLGCEPLPAHCNKPETAHRAPDEECNCGIHAAKKIETLFAYAYGPTWSVGTVIGKVALWGEVHEHEFGYRASYAYPQELFVSPELSVSEREALSAHYRVPVHGLDAVPFSPEKDAPVLFGVRRYVLRLPWALAITLFLAWMLLLYQPLSAQNGVALTLAQGVFFSLVISITVKSQLDKIVTPKTVSVFEQYFSLALATTVCCYGDLFGGFGHKVADVCYRIKADFVHAVTTLFKSTRTRL